MTTKTLSISALALALCLALPRLASGQACGNISSIGCCESDTVSKYCNSSGTLVTKDCTTNTTYKQCGWYSNKYQCTNTTSSDPNGTYPRLCSALPDGGPIPVVDKGVKLDTTKPACGNIGFTGCCKDATTAQYCSSTGGLSTKLCGTGSYATKPKCGWVPSGTSGYGCTACYTCVEASLPDKDPSNKYPQMCADLPDGGIPDPDKGTTTKDTGTAVPCGSITQTGCCDGDTAKYCASGSLRSKDCTATSQKCGWEATKNYYTCGTSDGEDPTGANPKACSAQPTTDTGVKKDTGGVKKDTGGVTPPKKDEGCGCAVGSGPTQSLLALGALLAVALLLGLRRR